MAAATIVDTEGREYTITRFARPPSRGFTRKEIRESAVQMRSALMQRLFEDPHDVLALFMWGLQRGTR